MRLHSFVMVLALGVGCGIAQAQPIQGFYVGASAGLRLPTPTKNTPIGSGVTGYFDLGERTGFDGRVSAGYALGDGWRFELEGTFGQSTISGVSGTTFPNTASGRVRTLGIMTNAIFDLDIRSPYVYPYLGAGVGYQWTRLDSFALTRTDSPYALSAGGQAGGFAWQSIVGLSLPIPNVPGLSITIDYRFMDVLGGEKFSGTVSSPPGAAAAGAVKFHSQFTHNVLFGIRYAFDTPAPAVAAPQAMASPADRAGVRVYDVRLALDTTTLTDRDRAVLRGVAGDYGAGWTARIELSGPRGTDDAQSVRGARAVEAALVAEGIPEDAIEVLDGGPVTHDPRRSVQIARGNHQ